MDDKLMDVLGRFVQRQQRSARQVAALSGVSARTVMNWLSGRVQRPHRWQQLVQVAVVLGLNESEATELLQSAEYPSIAELRREATAVTDQELLSAWPDTSGAPFQAIADLPYFVGREGLLAELETLLRNGRYVTLYSLQGMGGVGKTALAAHLAYRLRPFFSDGILWARLDTSDTMSILASFAAAYGQDVSAHHDIEARASAVRHILADKQALIVLDNAQTSAQIRPLLPPSTGKTAVLITTRQDLAVSDDMQRLSVESFPPDSENALNIFTHFLGQNSVRRWRSELQEIANLLGHLPLAIAIAAGRLAAHLTIPEYLAQLRAANQRLDSLVREDRSVRLSFDISYQTLPLSLQQFFVSLGAFGGDDFTAAAAAHVADVTETEALHFLQELKQLSLVQSGKPSRYSLHSLLRDYAREKSMNTQHNRRMVDWYISYATQFTEDYTQIGMELSNLTFALDTALEISMPNSFTEGVLGVFPTWRVQGDMAICIPYLEHALIIVQTNGDRLRQARILSFLGMCAWVLGKPQESEMYHKQGLQIAYAIENSNLICKFLTDLGSVAGGFYGDYDQAKTYLLEAAIYVEQIDDPARSVALFLALGNLAYEQGGWAEAERYWGEGLTHDRKLGRINLQGIYLRRNLGVLVMSQGRFDVANTHLNEALTLARDLNAVQVISETLTTLGQVANEWGDYDQAKTYLDEALTLARDMNVPEAIVQALSMLGYWAMSVNALSQSDVYLQEALAISQEVNLSWLETAVHLYLGELHLKRNALSRAQQAFETALETAVTLNMPEQQASALYGLTRTIFSTNVVQARQHAEESVVIFEELGHFVGSQVRQWLADHAG
jgi:tetratricopeptide (TPR) repeat protein/transcriptional regulator with XRE-family HTH domain